MMNRQKIPAFTLNELIVVIAITTLVVGMAFTVLQLIQKQFFAIESNYEYHSEVNMLRQALWLDFRTYDHSGFNGRYAELNFANELSELNYSFQDSLIIRETDTFNLKTRELITFFDGVEVNGGLIDAIKIEFDHPTESFIFVYKTNSANIYFE